MERGWLHIGNIAGNGFQAAKMQRMNGFQSDVINPYLTHVMSHPIWEDINVSTYVDLNDVKFLMDTNSDWIAPEFYFDGDFAFALRTLAENRGFVITSTNSFGESLLERWRHLGRDVYRTTKRIVSKLNKVKLELTLDSQSSVNKSSEFYEIILPHKKTKLKTIILRFGYKFLYSVYLIPIRILSHSNRRKIQTEFPNLETDQFYLVPALRHLKEISIHYDGIVLYGPWAALGAWCRDLNFIALEHGTLRDYIFEDDSWARACRLGFKQAKKVIVTNADCYPVSIAENHQTTIAGIHPFDDSVCEVYSEERKKMLSNATHPISHIVLASRIQFSNSGDAKGSDIALAAIRELHEINKSLTFTIFAYGGDLDLARKMIVNYELSGVVEISPPLSRPNLLRKFAESLCVLDGFSLSGSGRIQIEAWSVGTPVLSKQDNNLNQFFFEDDLPTINVSTKEEIVAAVKGLCKMSALELLSFQEFSIAWYSKNHSSHRFLSYLNWDDSVEKRD